jgi:hypothetical protein
MSPGSTTGGHIGRSGNGRLAGKCIPRAQQTGTKPELSHDPCSAGCITCTSLPHDVPDSIFAPYNGRGIAGQRHDAATQAFEAAQVAADQAEHMPKWSLYHDPSSMMRFCTAS